MTARLSVNDFDCTYPECDCPISWNGDGLVPESVCPKGLIEETGLKLLKFPAPDVLTVREALQKALDDKEPLTNVIILSQRENGNILHITNDGMTVAEANWILDSYKWWLMTKIGEKQ